jgi:predicted nucleic acid-binding protein
MNAAYIDTSFLLSIVFEDKNYERSEGCWNALDAMFSSVLLEIESRINIYKYYQALKRDKSWYQGKEKQLQGLLDNISRKTIDKEIVLEIKNHDKLKNARSLDGIHLATANILNKLMDERLLLCSYDKRMIEIGGEIGLKLL